MTDAIRALLSSVRARESSCPGTGRTSRAADSGSLSEPTVLRSRRIGSIIKLRSGTVVVAPAGSVDGALQRRTLLAVSASTLLVLVTFVTPLATGVRTAAALGTGAGGQAWLLSAMSVGLAAALLVAGEAADQLGRRRVFLTGLVLLAVGAALSGLANSTGSFLVGRLLEGLGGAGVLACSLGLLSAAFPPGPS